MKRTDLDTAKAGSWDVILVGSSFAACFFAHALRGRDLRVLFVERGPYIARDQQLDTRFEEPPTPVRQENSSGQRKDWIVRHQVGGCSNCWWGNTPRLHPNDFRMRSAYGIARDWPISYDDLEPYMVRAEALMEVAGTGGEAYMPRSAPYPYPAHRATRAERRMMEADPSWVAMPPARANGGRRGACCGSGACGLCPIDAKYTILNGMDAFTDAGFFLLTEAECRTVTTSAGAATGIVLRAADGSAHELSADFIGLGANPISNSAILLRSGLGGDLVGQGLHEQRGQFIWLDIPFDNYYGGTSITGMGMAFYDGAFRREAASLVIESWNSPPSLRLERGKWLQRLKLKLVAEDLPLPENRVVLRDDEATVVWTGHSDYALRGLARGRELLPSILPFEHEVERFGDYEPTEAHIIGGTPMDVSPEHGVVDAQLRVFGTSGLACLGASTFTTGAAANPPLTLSALSLYAGETL